MRSPPAANKALITLNELRNITRAAGIGNMTTNAWTLSTELSILMDAYWRASNYLSVGWIYLLDNPLLRRPLALTDIKHMRIPKRLAQASPQRHSLIARLPDRDRPGS